MRYLAILLLFLAACDGQSAFNADAWRRADLSTQERSRMARGLVQSTQLIGLDRAGVRTLLGPPTPTDKWDDSVMIYVLGPERGMVAIDHQWLVIHFEEGGRVSGYRIIED